MSLKDLTDALDRSRDAMERYTDALCDALDLSSANWDDDNQGGSMQQPYMYVVVTKADEDDGSRSIIEVEDKQFGVVLASNSENARIAIARKLPAELDIEDVEIIVTPFEC